MFTVEHAGYPSRADDIPVARRVMVRGELEHGLERDVPVEAPIVSEDKLVEISVDVLAAHPVIGAEPPALHQREDPVNPWQDHMSRVRPLNSRNHPAKAVMSDCQAAAAGISCRFQCQGNSSSSREAG